MAKRLTSIHAAILAGVLAFAVAAPTVRNGFAIDDFYLLVDNPAVHSLAGVPSLWREPWGNGSGGRAMYTRVNAASWRPLTSTVFALEWAAFGARPAPYHATSALLHAIATALVALIACALLDSMLAALVCACLFAVHPVHSEVLAAVTYQTTLLEAVFALATLWVVVRVAARGRARAPAIAALVVLPAAALLSKEEAVTLPLLAAAYLILARPPAWRRSALVCCGLVAGAVAVVLAVRATIVAPSGITFFGHAPRATVARTMLGTLVLDAELLVAPLRLCVFYDWFVVPFEETLSLRVVVGLALALATLAIVIIGGRRKSIVAVAAAWTAIPLLVVLQLVPILNVAAERFLYLPSVGFCLAVGWLAARLAARIGARATALIAALVVVAFAARTLARIPDWRDDRTLNLATARDFPETPTPYLNLATLDEHAGDLAAARRDLERALAIAPGYPPALDRLAALDGMRR